MFVELRSESHFSKSRQSTSTAMDQSLQHSVPSGLARIRSFQLMSALGNRKDSVIAAFSTLGARQDAFVSVQPIFVLVPWGPSTSRLLGLASQWVSRGLALVLERPLALCFVKGEDEIHKKKQSLFLFGPLARD